MEETVCIVKPDAVLAGLTDRVLGAAEDDGFYIVRRAEKRLTPARARAFYQHLEGTNAFRPAAEFLASGPIVVAVLSRVNAVRAWRERVGPTDPEDARELRPSSLRAQLGVDALRNVAHASATVKDAAREKVFLFPSGPLPGLIPKEYLLETLVMPGLVEALGELYVAQPADPYAWMAHWFATNGPPKSSEILEEWPSPVLRPGDALEETANPTNAHRHDILGPPVYEGTWNFRRCKDRDPVYGVGACDVDGARAVVRGLRKSGHRKIAWINVLDEPYAYVGGEPVCVVPDGEAFARGAGEKASSRSSFASLAPDASNGGSSREAGSSFDLERRESRLKSDVLASARRAAAETAGGFGGSVRVLGALDALTGRRATPSDREVDGDRLELDLKRNGGVPDPRAVATPEEAFRSFSVTGFACEYARIPVGRFHAPSERQFERAVETIAGLDDLDAALVFSCSDGIERATAGMIVGCLAWRGMRGDLEAFRDDPTMISSRETETHRKLSARPESEARECVSARAAADGLRKLGLARAKEALDAVIDTCDALFDARFSSETRPQETTGEARNDFETLDVARRRAAARSERYRWLLLFSAYCVDRGGSGFKTSFGQWTRANRSLRPTNDTALYS